MAENSDLNVLSEIDFLRKMSSSVQRHVSNLENTIAMMRNGHFIDSYQRIQGSKEGMAFIKQALEDRILSKGLSNENNTNDKSSKNVV